MEVNGYCELTVKAIENDDNSIRQYSVTVRLPDQDVAKSKTENTTLLQIMQMQNYYDILQVKYDIGHSNYTYIYRYINI